MSAASDAATLAARLRDGRYVVNHVVGHLVFGDAVSDDAANKWRALRGLGIAGELYYAVADGYYQRLARPLSARRPTDREVLLFHYSGWSEAAAELLRDTSSSVVLMYHNVTPSRWFEGVHAQAAHDTRVGRTRLRDFVERCRYALAVSEYNRAELVEAGFPRTGVVPIMVDLDRVRARGNANLRRELDDGYTNILSVGRLAPNKCHEDTIKLFYYYKRLHNPRSRLILAGPGVVDSYGRWLEWLVNRLGLDPHVLLPGHITNEDLAAYFGAARVYVSMSEHEGFCVPLLEAMAVGAPVLAYDATAVPFTLGEGGVLLRRKDFALGAELLARLVDETPLRQAMLARGRARLAAFAPERTRDRLLLALAHALGLIDEPRRELGPP